MFPKVNEDLTGTKPIDWDEVAKHYPNVAKYECGEIILRDPVMRSLCHRDVVSADSNLEDLCKNLDDGVAASAGELRKLAKQYIVFKNKNARLPGFGKWVNSMFPKSQEFNAILSKVAQHDVAPASGIVISCNPVDLLRGGLEGNFATCLGPKGMDKGYWNGQYADVIPAVLSECSGVAVAFVAKPGSENYSARCWIHHIEVNGKTAIQINPIYGNGMTEAKLAALIASKGYDVYNQVDWGTGAVDYKFINNFKRRIHWDAIEGAASGSLIAPAHVPKQKAKAA